MPKGTALSTKGMTLGYAVEAKAGERPTSGYTLIHDIQAMPALAVAPATLDSTTFEETDYKTSIAGLKDLGGAQEFGALYNELTITEWETLMTAYKEAKAAGKAMWFEIAHPNLTKAIFFKGEPDGIHQSDVAIDGVLGGKFYITVASAPIKETKSTVAAG